MSALVLLAFTERAAAVPIYAVDFSNGLLVFDSATPGTVTGPTPISGTSVINPSGETIIGIDFRPATGQLYAVTLEGGLYTINPTTAAATFVAALTADPTDTTDPFTALSGNAFGLDFNPVPDRLRLVTSTDQNLRINPTNGLVITDGPLAYAESDPNAATNPTIIGVAYTNNFAGASSTSLYGIDFVGNRLVTQNPPNNGTLNTVGPLGVSISSGEGGFDITATGQVFAVLKVGGTTNLYTINLTTGAATLVGAVGGNPFIRGISVAKAAPLTLDVNIISNIGDAAIDGVCDVDVALPGNQCSLRAAIQEANADNTNRDTITFSIDEGTPGVKTIAPSSALPGIAAPVIIDGYTQMGATPNTAAAGSNAVLLIELNGTGAGGSDGLLISAAGSIVRGLAINRSGASGIRVIGTDINIQGCFLGTDPGGTVDLGNNFHGVHIQTTRDNIIGGSTPAARNVISGNGGNGVYIEGIGVGGDASANQVQGNLIGTDATGTQDLGNSLNGVLISGPAINNRIGGSESGAGNVISGNGVDGVQIFVSGANSNVVQGNFIGTDATGTQDLGNSEDGVRVRSGVSNIIGGSSPGAGNVISGNTSGVQLGNEGATTTTVQGNFIGTDVTGSQDLGNSLDGIFVNSPNNIIGGTSASARNLISGNNDDGIHIVNAGSTGNLVIGNFVGTALNGTSPLGNGDNGVLIAAAPNNTVGGITPEARNIISGNGSNGVSIVSAGATGNLVRGNYIGTGSDGATAVGNAGNGVLVGISSNTIGGNPGAGNTVAYNTRDGVQIESVTNIPIFGNSIFSNGGLGINLLGPGETTGTVTPNDFDDSDTGSNNLQNFPVLESAMSNGGTTTITGTLITTPGDYFIDFYSNEAADPSGHGEGQTPLGDLRVTASERGEVTFSFTVPANLAGKFVAATASPVSGGGTSEFSVSFLVSSSAPTGTPTPTPSPAATATPMPTATASPTPAASPTATATPGATPSPTASPTASPAARAVNISTRLRVETGDSVLIGGFIIRGNVPKKIIVRALGASLQDDGIDDFLEDPILELHGPGGELIAQNDNWRDTQETDIEASGVAPEDDSESAIIATLPPGGYTVVLRGKDGTTGVALLEGYDLEPASDSAFRNISTRGFVQTGDGVMIGGFILEGVSEGTTVVLRGIGPSLTGAGLSNVLQNPTIDLRDENGNRIAFSDDWMENPAQAVQLTASGLAPSDSRESGLFTKLPPGLFTVILAGKNGGTGIGLVELYDLGN